jgi:rhodanese-related sulfurtransferase
VAAARQDGRVNPFDVPSVSLDELPTDAVLLDVREDHEWTGGHIDGAVHVPMDEIPNRVSYQPDVLSPDRQIVVVCKMGGRSAQVTGWLNRNGYRAVNLDGGMLAWATAGRPMTSEDGAPPRVV